MRHVLQVTPATARRTARIVRGPHACPHCEAPTWTAPPVPWIGLRDFVSACDACERPIQVRVNRSRAQRSNGALAVPPSRNRVRTDTRDDAERVDDFLNARGKRAFGRRLLAAALPLAGLLGALLWLDVSVPVVFAVAFVAVIPAAVWLPALVARGVLDVTDWVRRRSARVRTIVGRRRREPRLRGDVELVTATFHALLREEQLRAREQDEHPEVVLDELAQVLDARELAQVRTMAERGDVPVLHLSDLARYRRSWQHVA